MRITADIIDEEFSASEQDNKKDSKNKSCVNKVEIPLYGSHMFQDMLQKFQLLTVSDPWLPTQYNFPSTSTAAQNWVLHKMDSVDGDNAAKLEQVAKADLPDATEYPWLLPYLAKMKVEIKKEVMDEIMSLTLNKPWFQGLKRTAGKINEVVHNNIYCDHCDQLIRGIRYKCGNCSDFDLCQECENIPDIHDHHHIFLKIRYPVALKVKTKRRKKDAPTEDPRLKEVSVATARVLKPASHLSCDQKKKKIKKEKSGKKKENSVMELTQERKIKLSLDLATRSFGAKYVCDETIPDYSIIEPSTKFVKSWRVINSGSRPWTEETKLHYLQGPKDLIPESSKVSVPLLKPGEEGIVAVAFTSPALPGVYQSHWQFRHKNISFGHWLWCDIIVSNFTLEDEKREVNDLMQQACKSQNPWVEIIAPFIASKEQDKGEIPRKLLVSHTATPNNTPFDLTPPKSPDHQETLVKDILDGAANATAMSNAKENLGSDVEDECSVLSLSSSDSDTEFVVIPMPKCFNMPDSFITHHLPQLSHHLRPEGVSSPILNEPEEHKNEKEIHCECLGSHETTKVGEAVSKETGVPELTEDFPGESILVPLGNGLAVVNGSSVKSCFTCSSEVSIIESEDNNNPSENVAPVVDTISIAVTEEVSTRPDDINQFKCPFLHERKIRNDEQANNQTQADELVNEEHSVISDIPCSATFPKFPIEGITNSASNVPKEEERVIQVLPEGLVTGALSAAASVYNTAKALVTSKNAKKALSTLQPSRDEREPPVVDCPPQGNTPIIMSAMDQLIEMGFYNRQLNERLITKHNGAVALVVAELVSMNDNDWYASRHAPPAPDFD